MGTNRRLALLIDGDNAQAALLPQILAEANKQGTVVIRRVYGDWSEQNMISWQEVLHTHALQPVQQFRYTQGKNATDIALVIDAMDILHMGNVDGFCIASSDSDYTPLAMRIRQQNLFVIGIGKKTTQKMFVEVCDEFVFTEDLETSAVKNTKLATPKPNPTPVPQKVEKPIIKVAGMPKALKNLLLAAFNLAVQDDGWAHLGNFGHFIHQQDAEFEPRKYGHSKLLDLVQAYPEFFKVRKIQTSGGTEEIYVRLKVDPQKQNKLFSAARYIITSSPFPTLNLDYCPPFVQ